MFSSSLSAAEMPADIAALLDKQNVEWNVPGPSAREAMPVGNGDIALNVWVEPNGDLLFYIGKTDAWSEDINADNGLLNLGEVRVSLSPSQLSPSAAFRQVLRLSDSEILVQEGAGTTLRVWVDANRPVIRVEVNSQTPLTVSAALRVWRTEKKGRVSADVILPPQNNRVTWYHRNGVDSDPQSVNFTFGATISGDKMSNKDAQTLITNLPVKSQLISIYPLTLTAASADEWLAALDKQIATVSALNLEQTRREHQAWWRQFWGRSWIFVDGDETAAAVTQGYTLQRFITACAGRGAYPIKFNGSIFTMDYPSLPDGNDENGNPKTKSVTADHRDWGGQYWFQNTRPMYWPRLAAGDFDMMLPLFKMYHGQLAGNSVITKNYYGHDGTYFAETAPFWGGMRKWDADAPADWTGHYFCPILELSMMMLDYYDYTADAQFVKELLIPVAASGLQFYYEHFPRDAQGKLLLEPCNSIEMYWKVKNPSPDIAGLDVVSARLLALPETLTTPADRQAWKKLRQELPELPVGARNGKQLLLPYAGEQTAQRCNGENPELYAVYPYRLFGIGKPGLEIARRTFAGRGSKQKGCWVQDPIQAAMLGLADDARDYTAFALQRQDPRLKFPAYWDKGNDYMPDQDNGGNGEQGLQQMLLHADGQKIYVLPAWPAGWNASFKLNAPRNTTVSGRVENGKLVTLTVSPQSRAADVIDWSQTPPLTLTVSEPDNIKAGSVKSILTPNDAVFEVKRAKAGGTHTPPEPDEIRGDGKLAIDGDIHSKHFNAGQDADGGNPRGVNTGLVITPRRSHAPVTAIQFATANDMIDRDPLSVTVEGADDADGPYTLIYRGSSGLLKTLGRGQWGKVAVFENTRVCKVYRVLITETRGDNTDAVQFAELRLGVSE